MKLTPACEGIFKELHITRSKVDEVVELHAKQYTDTVDQTSYDAPKQSGGLIGYIGWSYKGWESTDAENAAFADFFNNKVKFKAPSIPEIKIYAEPPELVDTFDYKALGLEGLRL